MVGNISYRLGKTAPVEEMRAAVEDTPVFNEMFDRYLAHLKAHEIDPATSTLGPWLEIDRENECFKDNDKANAIVEGFYRAPYLLPKEVSSSGGFRSVTAIRNSIASRSFTYRQGVPPC